MNEDKLAASSDNKQFELNDACKVALEEIKNSKYQNLYKNGFKGIKDFGKSWCFIPESINQTDDEILIQNLQVLIVSKSNLNCDWVDHMYIIKDLKNSTNIEIPIEYKLNK